METASGAIKAISLFYYFAVVDACGFFYISTGIPGSVGDAAAYNTSRLARRIQKRKWLNTSAKMINGQNVQPYLVGEFTFALSKSMMKCYGNEKLTPHQFTFNYRVICTRCVVEPAFGRLKARFRVLTKNNFVDPNFATEVALTCCALHNVCERWLCRFEERWLLNHD